MFLFSNAVKRQTSIISYNSILRYNIKIIKILIITICSPCFTACVIAKSSLITNFLIAYPFISKTIGLSGWSRVEHKELISKISSRIHLSLKWYKKIICIMMKYKFKLHLLIYTREFVKGDKYRGGMELQTYLYNRKWRNSMHY